MKTSKFFCLLNALGVLILLGLSLQAAPIPRLFNTGVDDSGALLAAGAVDPHYKLITSADTNFPGPDTLVANDDLPAPPWLTNGPISKWIAPQPDQRCCGPELGGNVPGDYVYQISFNLSGFDLSTVKLAGQWAVDSEGVDIRINGTSTGNKIAPFPPQPSEAWHPFTISSGFVDGVNTLDFVVNRSSGKFPTGLRAEVAGTGILLPGPVLVPGLFNTGVDSNGGLLSAGAVDPHYKLIVSADTNFPGPNTLVANDDLPAPPWLTNGPLSKWIAPQPDQRCCGPELGGNVPGDYVYQISFNLSGFDLSTVKITGQWAVDSEGVDIRINGTSTGNKIAPFPPQPSEAWHPFTISSGFVDGVNTLDFVVNRSSGKFPTGLRAELSGTGVLFPQVPGLFNTGVDNNGGLLSAGAVDPHYKLIVSADTNFPGPDTLVANDDLPAPPWLTNGPISKWIAPQPDQRCCGPELGGNVPGDYVYQISFNLSGFDLSTVKITGQWAVDSEGVDIRINGTSTGNKIAPFPPQPSEAWHPFTISSGFVDGLNTLDFVVNRSSGKFPTGLRAEVSGTGATAGGGGGAPTFLIQPRSQAVSLGASATFLASVKGSGLSYQWRHSGTNIAGATAARLELTSIKESDLGVYDVVVSNAAGNITSDPATLLLAAPIPGLFNTGTDNSRALLADSAVDPHYKLIASADSTFPGPDALVVVEGLPISPAGTWVANGPDSRWISAAANQDTSTDGGNIAGLYTYRITFDLSGFDPATATITGQWAVSAAAPAVILNGKATGLQIGTFQPDLLLRPFTINSGFISEVNTLDFVVSATGSAGSLSATGLRVELQGIVGQLPPNTLATFLEQPQGQSAITGDNVSFRAAVRGSSPLTYQWRLNGANVAGATSPTLVITNISASNEGNYELVVTNPAGSSTSAVATLTVLTQVPGLFNTGTGATGALLDDGTVDLHYQLVTNANDPQSKAAIVEDSTIYPIVDGPYVANSATSKWIGPLLDPNAVPGDYVYRTTFDLTGFDPATVLLTGSWAVDDAGTDVLLNGASTGLKNGGFANLTPFVLTEGFKDGTNTLDFLVRNGELAADPTAANPTGFRVEGLRAGAKLPGPTTGPALEVTRSGSEVSISWPTSASDFSLFTAASLTAPNWTAVTTGIVVSGDRNIYKVQGTDPARFFRLQK